ncbi:MAG TPA: MFS transporter, partial [Mycobacteriales bacterium]|nr:MFS transporter [Mycobacteriales bacterium]
ACLAFIFIGSLLMQQGLGYSPVETGLAWLATTATIFPTAMVGVRISARVNIRWLLIAGLLLFTAGALWLMRVPAHGDYATDLLPAFLAAGIGFGLAGPAIQISALQGVAPADSGLAAGLVETMREIGGAAGVAAVSTALVAGSGLHAFHTAFAVTAVLAVAGVIGAAAAFAHNSRRTGTFSLTKGIDHV